MQKADTKKEREIESKRFYFAYGSNMDAEQMAERCPNATLVGKALLKSYRFIINSRGVATVVPDKNKSARGLVWLISEDDEAVLDTYEGVRYGTYKKKWVKVMMQDGRNISVLIYIASDSQPGVPRTGYLERIIYSAQKNGFSENYLQELKGMITRDRS